MALILTTGEYLAIESVTDSKIIYRLHENADARARYKEGTMGKYEITLQEHIDTQVSLGKEADPEKTITENLITEWYVTLKALPQFEWAIDA